MLQFILEAKVKNGNCKNKFNSKVNRKEKWNNDSYLSLPIHQFKHDLISYSKNFPIEGQSKS